MRNISKAIGDPSQGKIMQTAKSLRSNFKKRAEGRVQVVLFQTRIIKYCKLHTCKNMEIE
jgi:hypothetical protein